MTDINKLLEPYGMVPVNVETTAKLIAEIDRLRAELAAVSQCYKSLVDTEIRLRAQVEKLRWNPEAETEEELDRLRAEVELWKDRANRARALLAEHHPAMEDAASQINRLRAENEALRKQLMNNSPGTTSDGGKQPD